MDFGYFTLSDNRYPNNTRTAEAFVREIYSQAILADRIGMNSAWIGEHHFNLLGVNASPLAMLAQLAGATTKLTTPVDGSIVKSETSSPPVML